MNITTTGTHKIEEIISTHGTVIIGCTCGWVGTVPKFGSRVAGKFYANGTSAARALLREHKANS